MLTNGMFGTSLTPESTVTRTAFAASTCDDGAVLITVGPAEFELLELAVLLDPPPPPPQALTSSASSAAHSRILKEDI
jgi:hypothetical protein